MNGLIDLIFNFGVNSSIYVTPSVCRFRGELVFMLAAKSLAFTFL